MIAFVDVPPGTTFLPQAAELNDGQVVTFFSPLIEKLQRDGGIRPVAYPESTATDAGRQQRYAHWNWFTHHWNADKAVEVMEEVIGTGGRPRWIAYRMTFSSGTTLHLDVSARGDYDTGIFAYIPNRRSTYARLLESQGRSLGQIAARTGIPKTSLHRYLAIEAEPARQG